MKYLSLIPPLATIWIGSYLIYNMGFDKWYTFPTYITFAFFFVFFILLSASIFEKDR